MALAGALLGARTTIVMPSNAPAAKLRATREYGAQVIDTTLATGDREAIARKLQGETGGV